MPTVLKAAEAKRDLGCGRNCGRQILGKDLVIALVMDFSFIGGSMGSVVGEENCTGNRLCYRKRKYPL